MWWPFKITSRISVEQNSTHKMAPEQSRRDTRHLWWPYLERQISPCFWQRLRMWPLNPYTHLPRCKDVKWKHTPSVRLQLGKVCWARSFYGAIHWHFVLQAWPSNLYLACVCIRVMPASTAQQMSVKHFYSSREYRNIPGYFKLAHWLKLCNEKQFFTSGSLQNS